ncbi:hypothetical protein [Actinopolymorpha alba]|uniref:hypothetical protein n=1 Tax=Actinopolymorpha alba TaxID=533267 RepID=UPI00035DB30E|nr:hypothetical protein [Actinopolymorpha alba]
MSLNGYVSDLEVGDVLEPVTYEMSSFVVREYCHGVDEFAEEFHSPVGSGGTHYAPPTLAHIDKIRLIKKNCPGGPGPTARIHYEFHVVQHRLVPVGARLTASGYVSNRYEKKGRVYLEMKIEVRAASTDELLTTYTDTAILSYSPGSHAV